MIITEHIHAIEIPFKIPITSVKFINRVVFEYLIMNDRITMIDSGVSGSHPVVFDYLRENGREPNEISTLILSHSHPDHVGAAKDVKEATGCRILAHRAERDWIEDTEKQAKERPVPGFNFLVSGSVSVDELLDGGELIELEKGMQCRVVHTPGHSAGSISLLFEKEGVLFTGDALPVVGDLPIYDDIGTCLESI